MQRSRDGTISNMHPPHVGALVITSCQATAPVPRSHVWWMLLATWIRVRSLSSSLVAVAVSFTSGLGVTAFVRLVDSWVRWKFPNRDYDPHN
jgi:hypothetical protein